MDKDVIKKELKRDVKLKKWQLQALALPIFGLSIYGFNAEIEPACVKWVFIPIWICSSTLIVLGEKERYK